MKNIAVIGSGGFAKEVFFLIEEINRNKPEWNILGYIDNLKNDLSKSSNFMTDEELLETSTEIFIVFGVGNPQLLNSLFQKFSVNKKIKYTNLIHPSVIGDWKNIEIGIGNIICASCTLTTDIKIGNFNILNLDCTVGHDSTIGNFNVINPSTNISGGVILKNNCLLGTNATILQNITIESDIIIGASSLVTKNLTDSGTYVGVPAKKLN